MTVVNSGLSGSKFATFYAMYREGIMGVNASIRNRGNLVKISLVGSKVSLLQAIVK